MTPEKFFVAESIKLARSMNLPDAREYLRGMLSLIGECEAADEIRRATILLDESDKQLELIAKPQKPKAHPDGHN